MDYKQNSEVSAWCSFLCWGFLREVITAALTNGGEFCPIENMHMGPGMVPDFEVLSPRTVIPMSFFHLGCLFWDVSVQEIKGSWEN